MVVRSSAKAKYRSMAHGICELLWPKMLLAELGFPMKGLTNLFCDNKAVISIAHDIVQHDRTKHVEIDLYFFWITSNQATYAYLSFRQNIKLQMCLPKDLGLLSFCIL